MRGHRSTPTGSDSEAPRAGIYRSTATPCHKFRARKLNHYTAPVLHFGVAGVVEKIATERDSTVHLVRESARAKSKVRRLLSGCIAFERLACSIPTPHMSEPSSKSAPTNSPCCVRSVCGGAATSDGGSRTSDMRRSEIRVVTSLVVSAGLDILPFFSLRFRHDRLSLGCADQRLLKASPSVEKRDDGTGHFFHFDLGLDEQRNHIEPCALLAQRLLVRRRGETAGSVEHLREEMNVAHSC